MDNLDPLAWNLSIFCFNLNRLETNSKKREKQNLMILVNIYIKIYFKLNKKKFKFEIIFRKKINILLKLKFYFKNFKNI